MGKRNRRKVPVLPLQRKEVVSDSLNDMSNARVGYDFISLQWENGYFAPISFSRPEQNRINGRVHIEDDRMSVTVWNLAQIDGLGPSVIHKNGNDLLIGRQQRGVPSLRSARLGHVFIGIARDLLFFPAIRSPFLCHVGSFATQGFVAVTFLPAVHIPR